MIHPKSIVRDGIVFLADYGWNPALVSSFSVLNAPCHFEQGVIDGLIDLSGLVSPLEGASYDSIVKLKSCSHGV